MLVKDVVSRQQLFGVFHHYLAVRQHQQAVFQVLARSGAAARRSHHPVQAGSFQSRIDQVGQASLGATDEFRFIKEISR
ncbi:hypothetical protein GALL_184960 [mine drainage metagenome]|uniref:Uncharacterized protein n=1 Tax=mine drainage metagenome TaxID=410659 RepID=A0A1J5S5K4_9ZZZZ